MKPLLKIMIIVYASIAVCLTGLMIFVIGRGGIHMNVNSFGMNNLKLVNTQTADLEGIDSITLKYASDDIVFYTSENEELVLKEYMNFTPDENELTAIERNGSKLRLEGRKDNGGNWFFGANRNSRMEVYLPGDYNGSLSAGTSSGCIDSDLVFQLKEFEASCSSGDIKLNEVNADNITAATSSGYITFKKAEGRRRFSASSGDIKILGGSGDTEVSTSSGYITIENSAGVLRAKASSGDITVRGAYGEKNINTSSGYITVEDAKGYIKASASSGDIRISDNEGAGSISTTSGYIDADFGNNIAAITEDIYIESSSGDAKIRIPESLAFDFRAKTSSGDIDTFFDQQLNFDKNNKKAEGRIGANPSIRLDITTTSGIIKVKSR